MEMDESRDEITMLKRNRKTTLDWTPLQCLQLIALVKKAPCIWDITSTFYKERSRREIVWKNIAQKLNLPQNEIIAKWALLRQQFRNNHTKLQKSNANLASRIRKSPNEYYEHMTFIAPILALQAHMRENNLDEPPLSFKEKYIENCEIDPLIDSQTAFCKEEDDDVLEIVDGADEEVMPGLEETEESREDTNVDATRYIYLPTQAEQPRPVKLRRIQTKIERDESKDYIKLLRNAIDALQSKDDDQFEIWGRSIAATLRHYPDPVAVRRFKAAVSMNLAKLEAGQFDSEIK